METEITGSTPQDRPPPQTVYCLSIDLVGSTKKGLSFRSWELDKFNLALIEQIQPHLRGLRLEHAVVKFTGDGWLVMSPTAVSQLCCLGLIFRDAFRDEMVRLSGLGLDTIPPIRAALCSGRDQEVNIPKGQRDYVGDSARRAQRASALCKDNEVLVCTAVRDWILRDFDAEQQNVSAERRLPEKWEEDIALHVLTGLKPGLEGGGSAPAEFVYTLGKIGKRAEAVAAVVSVAERFEVGQDAQVVEEGHPVEPRKVETATTQPAKERPPRPVFPALEWNRVLDSLPDYASAGALVQAFRLKSIPCDVATYNILMKKAPGVPEAHGVLGLMANDGVSPNVVTYNMLVNKAQDCAEAARLVAQLKAAGITPDLVTYNTLVNKAEDYAEAARLVAEMKAAGIAPDLVTYGTLVNKAEDYTEAARLVAEMKAAGIAPNLVTYNTLVNKAQDYAEAARLVAEMKAAGVAPNLVTYGTLVNKAEDYTEAARLVAEMKAGGIAPDLVTYSTLVNKAEDYAEAARLVAEMKAGGIAPDLVTYSSLFSRNCSDTSAREILNWYYEQPYHPSGPLDALIASLRRCKRIDDALEIALQHPHLGSARRLMKDFPIESQARFLEAKSSSANHPTADFALGGFYRVNGDVERARLHLKQALAVAVHPNQRRTIEKWLGELARG